LMQNKNPTKEQQDIIDHPGNTVVTAKPGSGKTYTVVEKIANILPDLSNYQGVIAISYTNKASNELKKRCEERCGKTTTSFFGTIDGFYISEIIIPFAPHLTHSANELRVVQSYKDDDKYARLEGISEKPTVEQQSLIVQSLREGKVFLDICGYIAFYMLRTVPAVIKYIKAHYTHIFIDEYQDCGFIQHAVFTELIENGLIGVAVGDIDQAIYGFSGRSPEYLMNLKSRHDFTSYELTKNHRCHESIIEYSLSLYGAAKLVVDEKRVFCVRIQGNEQCIAAKIDEYLEQIKIKYGIERNNQVAILCRNNSGVKQYDSLLKTPHKAFEETPLDKLSCEWGRFFCSLLSAYFSPRTFAVDFTETLFLEEVDSHRYHQALRLCAKIFATPKNDLIDRVDDMCALAEMLYPHCCDKDSIRILREILEDQSALMNYAPASDDELNILTIHKSKGLEFNIVFHMDLYNWVFEYPESSAADRLQCKNLHYVAVTRAIDVCYLVLGTKRFRPKQGDYINAVDTPLLSNPLSQKHRRDVCW